MKSNASLSVALLCIFLISTQAAIDAVSENGERRSMQQIVPPNCGVVGRCRAGCRRCERVSVEVEPGEYVWRCECKGDRMLQTVPLSCYRRCGDCTPCVRVSEEVAPGEYVWKCVCKA